MYDLCISSFFFFFHNSQKWSNYHAHAVWWKTTRVAVWNAGFPSTPFFFFFFYTKYTQTVPRGIITHRRGDRGRSLRGTSSQATQSHFRGDKRLARRTRENATIRTIFSWNKPRPLKPSRHTHAHLMITSPNSTRNRLLSLFFFFF